MASTSTNKQPLLIDRVFNEAVLTVGLVSGNSNTALLMTVASLKICMLSHVVLLKKLCST